LMFNNARMGVIVIYLEAGMPIELNN